MFLHGPQDLAPESSLRREYQYGLDCHALGITALQVLMELSHASLADCNSGRAPTLLGALRDLQDAWEYYWDDISGFWRALYECFSNRGDWAALKSQCIRQGLQSVVARRIRGLKHALNEAARACIASSEESGASQLEVLLRALDAMLSDAGSTGQNDMSDFDCVLGSQNEQQPEGFQKHMLQRSQEEQSLQGQLHQQQELLQQLLQEKQQLLQKKKQQVETQQLRQSLPTQQSDAQMQQYRHWQQNQQWQEKQQHLQPQHYQLQVQSHQQQSGYQCSPQVVRRCSPRPGSRNIGSVVADVVRFQSCHIPGDSARIPEFVTSHQRYDQLRPSSSRSAVVMRQVSLPVGQSASVPARRSALGMSAGGQPFSSRSGSPRLFCRS